MKKKVLYYSDDECFAWIPYCWWNPRHWFKEKNWKDFRPGGNAEKTRLS